MDAPTWVADISLDELERDPYPIYARLRREAPVAWIPSAGVWFVTRFDACAFVGSGSDGFVGAEDHPTLPRVFGRPNVLTSGGPEHSDLRKGVDPPLQPGPVNQMVDQLVRPMARRHLDAMVDRNGAELMAEYLEPVSVEALRQVMGLDDLVDADTLRRWFAELSIGVSNFGLDPDLFARADRASAEIEDVVRPRLDELRHNPDHSMLSHMLWTGRDADDPRPVELIMPSLKVILLGGMQEPGHAAGSTLLGLFSRPDQLQLLYEDPEEYIPLAVHEGLRWIAPIGAVERQASRDVVLDGMPIATGDIVEVLLGSANRDETRFPDPDTFDLMRTERRHQAFGNGEHFCAGHFFARQVQRIMLEELFANIPGLRMDPDRDPVVSGWVFRAPKVLSVLWDERAAAESIIVRTPVHTPVGQNTVLLRVEAVRYETDDVLSVDLASPDGEPLPEWSPGAHIDLWVVDSHAGHYSLCGDPDDRHRWRLGVLRESESRGVSAFVHEQLRPGMLVHIGVPRNTFPLVDAPEYRFVAGGIGITPLLPMIRQASRSGKPFFVTYCGRSRDSLAFLEELAAYGDRVRLHAADEGNRADLETVMVEALNTGACVYSCGPIRMLDALEQSAETLGVNLTVERFTAGEAHRDDDTAFELRLEASDATVEIPADRTILDVLEERGLSVPNVCREGNCGSCETKVLAGAVDHRDVLLTPRQRRANDRMMICVSRAADASLTIDL